MTLNRDLTQLEPEEFADPKKLPAPAEKIIHLDIKKSLMKKIGKTLKN